MYKDYINQSFNAACIIIILYLNDEKYIQIHFIMKTYTIVSQ